MKLHGKNLSLKKKLRGKGLINKLINKLPFELHIPPLLFCGPGTNLKEKINVDGINPLDQACKQHDIYYSQHPHTKDRHKADLILQEQAAERAKAADATLGEKISATIVKNAMKLKRAVGAGVRKRGAGVRRKRCKKGAGVRQRKRGAGARRKRGGRRREGGLLLPLLTTALGALGSYSNFRNAKKALDLQKQQNEKLEQIIKGKGMFLKPYKGGGKKRFLSRKGRRRIFN